MIGLYNGSLDGVAGPETKRALLGFQTRNGLERTATLDQQTADALIGHTGVGQRSGGSGDALVITADLVGAAP